MIVAALAGIFRSFFLTQAGEALVEDDGPQKADCILVLGGDDYGTRVVKAAQLARAGYAPYVLVDGPEMLVGHESDMTVQYAHNRGFPESIFRPIWLPRNVNSTISEASYVGNILKKQGVKKVLMVTSSFHTRRAAMLFRRANPWLTVDVVAAPDLYFTPDGWWKTRDGQKTFVLEWMKTVASHLGI